MSFSGWSIRARLVGVIALITLVCLTAGFAVVGSRQIAAMRRDRIETVSLIARVVGQYLVPSLAFGDRTDATEALGSLRAFGDVRSAALYDASGSLFATFEADSPATWPAQIPTRPPPVQRIEGSVVEVRAPISHQGIRYGTILVRATSASLARQIRDQVATLLVVLLAMVLLSALAAWILQRIISQPILQLAQLARRISRDQDISLRGDSGHGGELGVLARGFNTMLDRLEARDNALRASHDTLRALINASPLGIIGLDAQRMITLWNSSAETIFGAPEGEAIGRPATELVPESIINPIWTRCLADAPLTGLRLHASLDRPRELALFAAPLSGRDGQLSGAVVVVDDITDKALAEQALAERENQLQRAQKLEVVGRLAGGVAHDFNNLLTVVIASCQLLSNKLTDQPLLLGYLQNIRLSAERGAALTRRLLAFGKRQQPHARLVDLTVVISELERMIRSVIGEHIRFEINMPAEHIIVYVDRGQLEQVLLNLVLNARDAMRGGGTLRLAIELGSHTTANIAGVAVKVVDSGEGMSAEVCARAFEPFFTTKPNGTGLGLATAQQIAHSLGGELSVQSQPDQGTTFTLWLPLFEGEHEATDERAPSPRMTGDETILLVEDEVELRHLVAGALREAGYRVLEAGDGAAALEVAAAHDELIELLLTDVVMPGSSGPQLARALLRTRTDMEVLYMSGYVGDALTERGLDNHLVALIEKPFTPRALLARVRQVLDAAAPRWHQVDAPAP